MQPAFSIPTGNSFTTAFKPSEFGPIACLAMLIFGQSQFFDQPKTVASRQVSFLIKNLMEVVSQPNFTIENMLSELKGVVADPDNPLEVALLQCCNKVKTLHEQRKQLLAKLKSIRHTELTPNLIAQIRTYARSFTTSTEYDSAEEWLGHLNKEPRMPLGYTNLVKDELLMTFKYRQALEEAVSKEAIDSAIMRFIKHYYAQEIAQLKELLSKHYPDDYKLKNENIPSSTGSDAWKHALFTMVEEFSITSIEAMLEKIGQELHTPLFEGHSFESVGNALKNQNVNQEIIDTLIPILQGNSLRPVDQQLIKSKRVELQRTKLTPDFLARIRAYARVFVTKAEYDSVEELLRHVSTEPMAMGLIELVKDEVLMTFKYRQALEEAVSKEAIDSAIMRFIKHFYAQEIDYFKELLAEHYPDDYWSTTEGITFKVEAEIWQKGLFLMFEGFSITRVEAMLEKIDIDDRTPLFEGKPFASIAKTLKDLNVNQDIINTLTSILGGTSLRTTDQKLIKTKRVEQAIDQTKKDNPEDTFEYIECLMDIRNDPYADLIKKKNQERLLELREAMKKNLKEENLFAFVFSYGKYQEFLESAKIDPVHEHSPLESLPMTLEVDFDPKKILLTHVKKRVEKAKTKEEAEKIRSEYQALTEQLNWTVDDQTLSKMSLIINSKPTATQEMD
ncbi:MAG: hypothetical protein H7A40_01245 [Chlamydiales bacterium]|nr:hypothetical protein [Chlamydiales bacterium]